MDGCGLEKEVKGVHSKTRWWEQQDWELFGTEGFVGSMTGSMYQDIIRGEFNLKTQP